MAAKKWPDGPPPKDALRFFRAKKLKPGFDFRDVYREEHAIQFTVAKAMEADILTDIRGALDQVLAEGRTFRQFQKQLTPRLQAAGWWGRKRVVDPLTGKEVTAQLGSPRRLRTIYRANVRTARAAGQWERIQRTKRALPYLLYELGPSREHRPEHVSWAGTILPADDSWWRTHYPPNGWGCKCRVRQITRREADRRGGPTPRPPIRRRDWLNRRTGEIERVPEGIDPGWDTNPGRIRRLKIAEKRLETAAAEKAAALSAPVARPGNPLADFPAPGSPRNGVRWRDEAAVSPGGIHRERAGYGRTPTGDCVLRALGNAFDADYGKLWRLARAVEPEKFGPGHALDSLKGVRLLRSIRVLPGMENAVDQVWSAARSGQGPITVAEARRRFGRDLILTGRDDGFGHMVAVMDGAIVDTLDSRGMEVRTVWVFDRRRVSAEWRAPRGANGLLVQRSAPEE